MEILEWRTAENSASHLLRKLRILRETNPKLQLLDVGCGPGTITVGLAQAIPGGHVTGVDLNAAAIPRARAGAAAAGVANVTFREGDAFRLDFPDDSFDVTHCHQVLARLRDPGAALREMLRVTKKPGGLLAAREGDLASEIVHPPAPGLAKFRTLIEGMITAAGGSATAGRELLGWALRAGAAREQITLDYGTWCYSSPADKKVWAQSIIGTTQGHRWIEAGIQAGLITQEDVAEIAKDWAEWQEKDDASLAMMSGEIMIQL